jgi:phosphate transport system ATP-binding protein
MGGNGSVAIALSGVSKSFGGVAAVDDVTLEIGEGEFFSLLGPSGCGKTTTLRMIAGFEQPDTGKVVLQGADVTSVSANRRPVNMVFQQYALFPHMSIYENVAFGARRAGVRGRVRLDSLVRDSLEKAGLWEEVQDRLDLSGQKLSGGQQQRLCLARILALGPEFILLDEPTSGLDPISTMKIEESLRRLKKEYTIVLVTNNTKQAARVADRTAFFLGGELIEVGPTERIFTAPDDRRTDDYLRGRFG